VEEIVKAAEDDLPPKNQMALTVRVLA
jgi:hypothetical protein